MGMLGDPVLWVDPNALKASSGVLSDAVLNMYLKTMLSEAVGGQAGTV